jgi:hypothetical protein
MSEIYCKELIEEFKKLSLNEEEKNYTKEFTIYHMRISYPGRDFYKWKETENAVFYRKPSEVYEIYNDSLFMLGPSKMIKLDVEKEIKVYDKNGYLDHCF